ncbi:MAG: RNA polymerase sigma factor, partial [Myxococcales bacterium]|nr:RNA polymerase sigma factor [Myxococcales bacterium]
MTLAAASTAADVRRILVENHARFLDFLARRVASRDEAEEILQDAFVRGIDRADSVRDGESATAWFYRLLRNALVDHHRRRAAEQRALERAAAEPLPEVIGVDEALMQTVCACVVELVSTLRPSYAEVIRAVDLEGATVTDFAATAGITANNAAVR